MAKKAVTLLMAFVLCAAATASAQERKDLQIFRDISDSVHRYSQFSIFDGVEASVTQGHVVLDGWVTMPFKKDDIDRRVRKVAGVTSVDNRIQVLPVSQFDDELRFRIARAIYGNSAFWNYAAMANPPIHIVVNGGRVALQGVVQSNVERQLARSLATGFGSFEVKNQLKTDDEVQAELEKIGESPTRSGLRIAGTP
ncbi:MAG TPA: BON domain-containing protein [Vicinamibacterales bacterium]|nr:BON domain-containing protein [Vicinamibacterales bacterium]